MDTGRLHRKLAGRSPYVFVGIAVLVWGDDGQTRVTQHCNNTGPNTSACGAYYDANACATYGTQYDDSNFTASTMCCACGGGINFYHAESGFAESGGFGTGAFFSQTTSSSVPSSSCVNTAPNQKDCSMFTDLGACMSLGTTYDSPSFTASKMCCACGGGNGTSNFSTSPDNMCIDTAPALKDCAIFTDPDQCRSYGTTYDSPIFTASTMCCRCGGGRKCWDSGPRLDSCEAIPARCSAAGDTQDFSALTMCCICGGGQVSNTSSPVDAEEVVSVARFARFAAGSGCGGKPLDDAMTITSIPKDVCRPYGVRPHMVVRSCVGDSLDVSLACHPGCLADCDFSGVVANGTCMKIDPEFEMLVEFECAPVGGAARRATTTTSAAASNTKGRAVAFTLSWEFQGGDAERFAKYIDNSVVAEAAGASLNINASLIVVEVTARTTRRLQVASTRAPTVFDVSFVIVASDALAGLSDSELISLADKAIGTLIGVSFLTEVKSRVPVEFHSALDSATLSKFTPPIINPGVAVWLVGAWWTCDCTTGNRYRSVMCSAYDPSLCPSPKPEVEQECTGDCDIECPFGWDSPLDCEAQAIVRLVLLALGCCCCYSCCIWCICKMRAVRSGSVVVKKQGGDSGKKEVPSLRAKYEIFDDPEKASGGGQAVEEGLGVTGKKKLVRWSYDGGVVDQWFDSGDQDAVVKLGELVATGDADAKEGAGKPEDGSTGAPDPPKDGDDADAAGTRHVAILDAPADDAPDPLLAYGQNARIEYFSSTLSLWLSGYVMHAQALAETLNNSSASNKNNKSTKHVPDYNIKLANGQLRYDVSLDEIRSELEIGEKVEARVAPNKTWVQGIVKGRVSGNPTQHGYIVEIAGRDPPQARVSAVNVRRYFPVGDKVDAYLGIDRGWASCVVVADPPAKDLLASADALGKFSLNPEWHRKSGSGKAETWTMVVLKLPPSSDGDADAASVAVPSFLLRRVSETGNGAAAPKPGSVAMLAEAPNPPAAQSPIVKVQDVAAAPEQGSVAMLSEAASPPAAQSPRVEVQDVAAAQEPGSVAMLAEAASPLAAQSPRVEIQDVAGSAAA